VGDGGDAAAVNEDIGVLRHGRARCVDDGHIANEDFRIFRSLRKPGRNGAAE
jgi:hypothetical protein